MDPQLQGCSLWALAYRGQCKVDSQQQGCSLCICILQGLVFPLPSSRLSFGCLSWNANIIYCFPFHYQERQDKPFWNVQDGFLWVPMLLPSSRDHKQNLRKGNGGGSGKGFLREGECKQNTLYEIPKGPIMFTLESFLKELIFNSLHSLQSNSCCLLGPKNFCGFLHLTVSFKPLSIKYALTYNTLFYSSTFYL